MQVKVINKSKNALPEYGTKLSAGADVRADIPNADGIAPGGRMIVPTGLYVAIPEGYEIQVRPRSGLAAKHGITVLNSPGTIDADYRGEIGVILINTSDKVYTLQKGERIGQLVLSKFDQIDWVEVEDLDETARGEGGFGSTGKLATEEATEPVFTEPPVVIPAKKAAPKKKAVKKKDKEEQPTPSKGTGTVGPK